MGILLTACHQNQREYVLAQEDIKVHQPPQGFVVKVGQLLRIEVESVSDEGVTYKWLLDDKEVSSSKNLEYMIETIGEFQLKLEVKKGQNVFDYHYKVIVDFDQAPPTPSQATAYITKVFDYLPAVGQFTNTLPEYVAGDTQQTMNKKVLDAIGNNHKGMISLGGFGGYVVVGFDHTIQNIVGKRDFRVIGNAFYSNTNPEPGAPQGGSCEAGVIMVAYDVNKNGEPDDNEWYEIAGSAHQDPTKELWYDKAKKNGNDIHTYYDYQITYFRPAKEPTDQKEWNTYIRWQDNKEHQGYKSKNAFHSQSYFPLWVKDDKITFKGTCLPQNGIDESGQGDYFVLYKFSYGYADNEINSQDESAIDISWAVNSKGQKVNMPGVDFIKIYTGINQENGWLGECSTEITGIEDLHILKTYINTRK
ncbi:MAG: PKD-like domain-containing protein [Mucinivorans sp.]